MALQIPYSNEEFLRLLAQANAYAYPHSNPNLLDNWYFPNPVNQRGATSYETAGYSIDRFYNRSANTKLSIVDHGLKIEVVTEASGTRYMYVSQRIENFANLLGKQVTVSFLVSENATSDGLCFELDASNSVGTNSSVIGRTDPFYGTGICSKTFTIPSEISYSGMNAAFLFYGTNELGSYAVIEACKVELGDTQTLAHQDDDGNWVLNEIPDYGEQLARCRRYLRVFRNSSGYTLDFPAVITDGAAVISANLRLEGMCAIPTVSFSGGLIVRNADGYLSDASYSSPYTEPVFSFSNASVSEAALIVAKVDGSVWSAGNNTTCMLGLGKDSALLLSAEG